MVRISKIVVISVVLSVMIVGCGSQPETVSPTDETSVPEVTDTLETEDAATKNSEEDKKTEELNAKLKEGSELIFSDPDKALSIFENLAADGNKDAAFLEGYIYSFCLDDDMTDHEKAFSLFEEASESNPYAKICLAYAYKFGRGVEKDESRADQLFDETKKDVNEADNENLPYSVVAYELVGDIYKDKDITGQDYKKSRFFLAKAAALGNVPAMISLGNMYDEGEGVEQDYTISKYYYYKAIQSGSSDAMYYIAMKYKTGKGFDQDLEASTKWLERAADLNNQSSINDLGYAYQTGIGVEPDYVKAVELYEKAADLGDMPALVNLASMYIRGQGVEKNYDKAVELCEKAAEKDFPNGYDYLGHLYQEGMGVEQNYEKAVEYYEKAIEAGKKHEDIRPGHYADLATMYEKGLGVEKDQEKAKELKAEAERINAEKAAEQQKEPSETDVNIEKATSEAKEIGDDYLCACLTMFTEPDEALSVFDREADTGNKDAKFLAAYMYYLGLSGKERDLEKANKMFEELSDQNPYAKLCLGRSKYNGLKMEKDESGGKEEMDKAISEIDMLMADILPYSDVTNYLIGEYYLINDQYDKAVVYFEKSENNPMSMNLLGGMYYNGNGVGRDMNKSIECLEKAANLGVGGSAEFLGRIYDKGMGVSADPQKAEEWYKKAEELGVTVKRD